MGHDKRMLWWCGQVFCLEQPSRDGKFYRGFLAADYAALWAHHQRAQQRHFYEARRPRMHLSLAASCLGGWP